MYQLLVCFIRVCCLSQIVKLIQTVNLFFLLIFIFCFQFLSNRFLSQTAFTRATALSLSSILFYLCHSLCPIVQIKRVRIYAHTHESSSIRVSFQSSMAFVTSFFIVFLNGIFEWCVFWFFFFLFHFISDSRNDAEWNRNYKFQIKNQILNQNTVFKVQMESRTLPCT